MSKGDKKGGDESALELKAPLSIHLKNKRVLIMLAVLLLAICIGAALLFSKIFNKTSDHDPASIKAAAFSEPQVESFYDMDEIVVNLISNTTQRHYLKLILSFRLSSTQDSLEVGKRLREIQDSYNVFLKELRPQDFSGSGATLRLKEELTKRVNKIMYPIEVKDLLFKEILVD
ncbi:MAG: flagellar basal body-associated FliL family protein [Pseudomonadota bacterium]